MNNVVTLNSPEVVIEATADVGEGPVFDPRTGRLCWVDITGGMIFENDLANGSQTSAHLDTMVGAIAPRAASSGFAVALSDGFGFWDDDVLTIADPVLPEPHRRMNDAKCDSRGRLWAGSNHMEFVPGVGELHRWDGSSPSVSLAKGLTLPNGLGWSPDDRTMYLVDSMRGLLSSAPFDADAGVPGEFTVLCELADGLPDGLTVDAEGCIWVAMWSGWQVRRISPSGELLAVVPMPVSQPSSCAFGPDGTLYITSARSGLDAESLVSQPHAGSVFALSTTVTGVPVAPFAG